MVVQKGEKKQAEGGVESPAEFLANMGKALLEQENVDTDLAKILAIHLLTTTPTADSIAKAKTAILKLAKDRLKPPEADNG